MHQHQLQEDLKPQTAGGQERTLQRQHNMLALFGGASLGVCPRLLVEVGEMVLQPDAELPSCGLPSCKALCRSAHFDAGEASATPGPGCSGQGLATQPTSPSGHCVGCCSHAVFRAWGQIPQAHSTTTSPPHRSEDSLKVPIRPFLIVSHPGAVTQPMVPSQHLFHHCYRE